MGFNIEKFNNAKFQHREAVVKVPDLADFFGQDDAPEWKLRGLTGHEMAAVREAAKAAVNIDEVVGKLLQGSAAAKADAVKEALGVPTEAGTPEDLVRRIHMLKYGSIDPACDQRMAVKLADSFVIVFYQLTNKITELTGLGKRLGE